ncbi:hypothetical protein LCGC14_1764390 [marine sediment metagenome]|uniref:Uncharacterized protein n=1 Tax=marine sediment metagenome TaxID=412755 RepID=A0A0F9H020_9ZZZZ
MKCRCCNRVAKLFGVYCLKCMATFRMEKKYADNMRAYYRALEYGSGDLWRLL